MCIRALCLSVLLLPMLLSAQAPFNQDPSNPNLDFSQGNFDHWDVSWYYRSNPDSVIAGPASPGSPMVVQIYGTNWDGHAGTGNLPRVPSGLERVARHGDPSGSGLGYSRAYQMRYRINVQAEYPVLFLQLAALLDNSHGREVNTHYRFSLEVEDQDLLPAPPCSDLELFPTSRESTEAGSYPLLAEPLQLRRNASGSYHYQPWNTIGYDLSAFIGGTVILKLQHYDCGFGVHGSYTYFSAAMRSAQETIYFCRDADQATIAPYTPRFKSYLWNTGDTTESITVNAPVDGATYICTYTSFNGCSMQRTYVLRENPLQADFSYIPGACRELLFTENSHAPVFGIANWSWTFGDPPNDTDTTANAAHTYGTDGIYTVQLTVQDSMGCADAITQQVVVDPISLTTLTHAMCQGESHTFGMRLLTVSGTYRDTLNSLSTGCDSIVQLQLTVHPLPIAAFSAPASICAEQPVAISNNSTGGNAYLWYLGDGPFSTLEVPSHVYSTPGTWSILLTATSAAGCVDSVRHAIVVHPVPSAAFEADPMITTISAPRIVLTDRSTGATAWWWTFGDGYDAMVQDPVHVYTASGLYEVHLVASNEYACSDTAALFVLIRDELLVPNVFTPNGDGINDTFRVRPPAGSVERFALDIYDRWGLHLFHSTRHDQGWNGKVNGEPAPEGVYYYRVTIGGPQFEQEDLRGAFQLLR